MSFCGCCPYFFAEFGGITGVPAYKREEWIENYWEKPPNFVAAVCDDIYIERQEQQHWGWESWKNFVGNISEGVVKPEFLCLFIPWGVKWRGLLSGISSGFVFPDLVFLFCSNVCFPSIFGLDGVEAGFAPEKVFDVICWCLVKCDDSAKIVWKKSEKYLDN